METVSFSEAKARLEEILDRVAAGEEILIAKDGQPVACLKPCSPPMPKKPRRPGGWEGKVWIAPDFNETPQEVIDSFYNSEIFPKREHKFDKEI
jgi:prevent-host-death family protein